MRKSGAEMRIFMSTEYERMKNGLIYDSGDQEILDEQIPCLDRLQKYNSLLPSEFDKKKALLKEMLGAVGDDCYIEIPFRANWGGKHVFIGNHFYSNFNLTLVDDGNIYFGDHVMVGPNVTIAAVGHPVEPNLRQRGLQFCADVHIGNNVWLGANVVILPGVSIGDNSVIGAGSVVTKDIPANVVAVGNPCKIQREIGEQDRIYYFKDRKIDL